MGKSGERAQGDVRYRGLCVGVDRYQDENVPWLRGAARDATAVHAIFEDTLGDGAALLTDEAATGSAVRASLADLARESGDEDIVIVFFAGHGTSDHRLVPFDAVATDVANTCIALDEVAEAIAQIGAKGLLCVLDCCFSGGLGSRVFATEFTKRSAMADPIAEALNKFVGSGRLALCASAANEPALESNRHGHGLLTFRFLEALQGIDEVREGDQLSLLKLVDFVVGAVQADARQMGEIQTPTLRGQLDGKQLWPILTPGSAYAAAFPDRTEALVSEQLDDLTAHGVSGGVVNVWSESIGTLNQLQIEAINHYGLLKGESLVVTAPTSSGKTMVGEIAALSGLQRRQRAIFLLPMRALVNDKFEHFRQSYGPLGITTIRATGEHSDDIPELLAGRFDLALLTYETFSALALGNPHVLDLAGLVVVDEAQILTDRNRGSNLEFVITLLNNRRGSTGSPQIITLSAVVGDLGGLERWLGARNLHTEDRPIPLQEGVLHRDGSLRFLDENDEETSTAGFIDPLGDSGSRATLIPLVRRLVGEDKKVIVFRQTKGEATASAVYLSKALALEPAQRALDRLPRGDASTSSEPLAQALAGGVALHSTDLTRAERHVVETEFRDPASALRVVTATPTLAMGVNTPAEAVAIVGLTHPGPTPTPYTVAEYKNMVGRAGRLGISERGESFLIPEGNLDSQTAWTSYVNGHLEPLVSQLVPDGDPRTLMLRVLASYPPDVVGVARRETVVSFLSSSFAAQQQSEGGSSQWTEDSLTAGLKQLERAGLISTDDGDGTRLTELGRFAGESGVHVDSIVRLVHGLRGTSSLDSVGLIAAAQLTNELDDVYLGVNARAKNTEVPRWPRLLRERGVPGSLIDSMRSTSADVRQAVSRHKKACAAAMWASGTATRDIELSLTQHLRQRGSVAGAMRAVADRTRDLLPAVGAVLESTAPGSVPPNLVERTMIRLELGIPADAAELARQIRVDLDRTQWLALVAAGLTDFAHLGEAGQERLADVLGSGVDAQKLAQAVNGRPSQEEIPSDEELLPPATE